MPCWIDFKFKLSYHRGDAGNGVAFFADAGLRVYVGVEERDEASDSCSASEVKGVGQHPDTTVAIADIEIKKPGIRPTAGIGASASLTFNPTIAFRCGF